MASADGHLGNSRPAKPDVIRHAPDIVTGSGIATWWLLPGLIISGGFHALLFCLLAIVNFGQAAEPAPMETTVIETKVEDNPQEKNLENDEIGNDRHEPLMVLRV